MHDPIFSRNKWQEKKEEGIAIDLKKPKRPINQMQYVWTLLRS